MWLAPVVVTGSMLLVSCADAGQEPEATIGQISQKITDEYPESEVTVQQSLKAIAATPDTNAAMTDAIRASDTARVQSMLVEHGANAAYLDHITIDLSGRDGTADANVLSLSVGIPPKSPDPEQLIVWVHICGGWVDWWHLDGIGWRY